MTINKVHLLIKKGRVGNFRAVKPGEEIEASDIVAGSDYYDFVSEENIGAKADENDTLIRLTFIDPRI